MTPPTRSPALPAGPRTEREDAAYLRDQLITCIGNKRLLLPAIGRAAERVAGLLGHGRLRIFDGFSGSGVVSRRLRSYAGSIVANDLEAYARVVSRCYLTNRSAVDLGSLTRTVEEMNRIVDRRDAVPPGFVERLYAPVDDTAIRPGERVFYTRDNARRLDAYRTLIGECATDEQHLLLGPLLSAASVHANTAGVFKGFYKDRATGIGKLGGSGADALERITRPIRLEPPVLSRFETDATVFQEDANRLIERVGGFDLAYFDPPYNQHPYGSNYFMLNLLVDYREPHELSRVSGIPVGWNRSVYNVRKRSFAALRRLVVGVDAEFVLLSFNDEGFVRPDELRAFLAGLGVVEEIRIRHNTFRGSRNLRGRRTHVTEHLFLLRKRSGG
ncbi:MAG: DNA adenine methylase [Acidimicrobiales bacterium]